MLIWGQGERRGRNRSRINPAAKRRDRGGQRMLKQQRSLVVDFAVWIVAAALLILVLPVVAKASLCDFPLNKGYLERSGYCEQTKLTDLAVIFFTSCLVIVGWFSIRSGERNTKDL